MIPNRTQLSKLRKYACAPAGEIRSWPRTAAETAMLAAGLLEEAPRLYYGPREPGLRITDAGRRELALAPRSATATR